MDAAAVRDLAAALLAPIADRAALVAIERCCEALRAAPDREAAAAELAQAAAAAEPVLLHSALAAVDGDLGHYARLLDALEGGMATADLDRLNHVHWCINRQLFLMRMEPASHPRFVETRLFPWYRRLLAEIARRTGITPPRRALGSGRNGRIALVTNQFLSTRHQPSRDLLSYATLLEERCGREVVILNTNLMPVDIHSLFVPTFAAALEPSFDGKQVIEVDGRSYRLLSSTGRRITAATLDWFMRAVAWHDPDVVVALGGSVAVADLLAGHRPTLCIPTTTGATLSLANIVLDFGGGRAPEDGPLAASWRPFRFFHSLAEVAPPDGSAMRVGLGVDDNTFLCAVVGNRLDHEIDSGFLGLVERILDQLPHAVVVFAGQTEALPTRLAGSRHVDRLRCLGYMTDMGGLLAACDAYLNPRRIGGGASAAEALATGAVPVAFTDGDVASVIGDAFAVPDEDAYIARAVALATDPALRAAMADAGRRRLAGRRDPQETAEALAAYLDEAMAVFERRSG